ncbi:hypothetical protein L873DRAFT_1061681 [Choiromyces venosus 120613-1]|uniref:Uncharacterized protein n=1 Tax=Choiromyces venosus 120613-1 TaxID=1336337 RepID=A0A3N4JIW9_9PEZI|nr:hypothetical protein L873DRAFT_1061681 [Choiromyces venosus 120613-1]
MAIEMAAVGTAPSLSVAAEMVGEAPSTVMHRQQGRKSKDEEASRRQKMTAEEEQLVVERCHFHC